MRGSLALLLGIFLTLGSSLLGGGCARPLAAEEAPEQGDWRTGWEGRAPAVRGGAVASSEPHATEVGAQVLAAGGNAVDAAVAVGFALAVTWPYAGNLGGGGFLLHRDAEGGAWFLDFREVAPRAAHRDLYLRPDGTVDARASRRGWLAAGVPGSVPGLCAAHERWGSLPLRTLLAPAIRLAEQGFPVSAVEHRMLERAGESLGRDPLAARVFYEGGQPLPEGAQLRQPELAATLRAVADRGAEAFRRGPIVDALVAASDERGGIFTRADFEDYRPRFRPLRRIEWMGLELLGASPPSSGGIFLEQVLASLEGHPLEAWGFEDARTVQLLGEATARAFHDRNRWLGDPAGLALGLDALVDPDMLARRAQSLDPARYTPPSSFGGPGFAAPPESGDTTHYSVVDGDGAAVAVTTTLNGLYGAQVMAPGGFLLNNEMDDFAAAPGTPNLYGLVQGEANAVAPGRRPLSSMCPVIVVRDGEADAVLGSPGGPTILSTVLQVLLNRYLFEMTPREAVAASRFHRQDLPPDLLYEPDRLDAAQRGRLEEIGQPLRERDSIGDVNAVFRGPEGWIPVADPRASGLARSVP